MVTTAFQPIVDASSMRLAAVEALSRFEPNYNSPAELFATATRCGLDRELEMLAIRAALCQILYLPRDIIVSINASPRTLISREFSNLVAAPATPSDRLIVELTEHTAVGDYSPLLDQISLLRSLGVQIAVDDAGGGYSSFKHILQVRPDFIKLDRALVTGLPSDPARRALVSALVEFADQMDAVVIGEGVERHSEFRALADLGVHAMQGYLFARPSTNTADWQDWAVGFMNHRYTAQQDVPE